MNSYKTLLPYFKKYRLRILIGLISLLLVDFFQLLIPRVVKYAIDELASFRAEPGTLVKSGLALVGLAFAIGLFRYVWRLLILGFSRIVEKDVRERLYTHLVSLSPSWFLTRSTGDIMAHATNDLEAVRMASGMGLVALTDAIVMGAASIGFMIWISPKLTLLALIPMPLISILTRYLSGVMYKRYRSVQDVFGRMTGRIREYLDGIRVIQAHVREELVVSDVDRIGREYVKENIKLNKVSGAFYPLMLMFTNLSLAIVLYFGGRMTIFTTISAGDFVAFISYLGILTWPLMALGWVTNLIQRGAASLDRINNVLRMTPEILDREDAVYRENVKGDVELKNLTFSYPGRSRKVLDDVSARFLAGKCTALVGRTGSGKTTLLNMIPRLFSSPEKSVFVDGLEVEKYKLGCLRGAIGYVPQDGHIFSGSIRENIAFGIPDATIEEIVQAAESAEFADEIKGFKNGFDTFIGERGVTLSGGQKQRLALARALMINPPLLILDDTLSAVDAAVEERILSNIARLRKGKSTIIVSHRLSSIKIADRIHVLENGTLSASGTHNELTGVDGYYARLHSLQSMENNTD